MNWRNLSLAVIALLLVTNLVTGARLRSSTQQWKRVHATAASVAVGQINEAGWDLEPVTLNSEPAARDRILSAVMKLQIAYDALIELERDRQLAGGPRTWSMSVNVTQGPLRTMLITGDYSELPAVKARLAKMAALIPLGQSDALAELRMAQPRLDEVFAQ